MRCFAHPEVEAVGVCRACGRGLCAACAGEAEGALACKGRCEPVVASIRRQTSPEVEAQAAAFREESRARSAEVMRIAARQLRVRAGAAFVAAACLVPIGLYEPASRRPFWFAAVAGLALVGWLATRAARRYAALALVGGPRPAAPPAPPPRG